MEKVLLYNTLKSKREVFKPLKGKEVRIYTCGPTVYSEQHIGNMRSMFLADILIRILKHNNYKIKHITNYTDVGHLTSDTDTGEDKVEKAAKKEGMTAKQITKKYIDMFESDLSKLNIELGKRVKATDYIKEQIDLIKKLEKKGYTYQTSDGVYFNTKKFKKIWTISRIRENRQTRRKESCEKRKKELNRLRTMEILRSRKKTARMAVSMGCGIPRMAYRVFCNVYETPWRKL